MTRVGLRIRDHLPREHVFVDVAPGERDDVIRGVVERLSTSGAFEEDAVLTVFRGILKRERVGSTGLGRGIAIPHCRTSAVEQPVVAFAKLVEPIDYGATDGAPVHSLFMVISPLEARDEHVGILSWIARMARSEYYTNLLRTTRDADSLHELFLEVDDER